MTDTTTRVAGPTPSNPNTLVMTALATTPIGTPLVQSLTADGTSVAGRANATDTTKVVGLQSSACAAGEPVHVQYAGPLTLTTAEWDAICGTTGGLDQGIAYYLSTGTAGKIQSTIPSGAGNFIEPVGVALSATTMMIQILPAPIVIGS